MSLVQRRSRQEDAQTSTPAPSIPAPWTPNQHRRSDTGPAPEAGTPPAPGGRRSRLGLIVGAGAMAAVGAIAAVALTGASPSTSGAGAEAVPLPVSTLPATAKIGLASRLADLPTLAQEDVTQSVPWRAHAKQAAGSATIVGRSYGDPALGPGTLKIVAARTDLTGRLELGWAGAPGTAVGGVLCTNVFRFNAQSEPKARPTMMMCWHSSSALTVYGLAIDPSGKAPLTAETVAEAVTTTWKSAATGSGS